MANTNGRCGKSAKRASRGYMAPLGGMLGLWLVAGIALATASDGNANSTEQRIKPYGEVSIVPVAAHAAPHAAAASANPGAAGPANSDAGKSTYNGLCMGCHGSGALGSPKFGDKPAWAPRIAQGLPALYANALKGKKNMPAKGGNPGLADADVKAAVDYMIAAAK